MADAQKREIASGEVSSAGFSWLEWVASGAGLLLAVGLFGLLGWQAFKDAGTPPILSVAIDTIEATPAGYRVAFRASNTGGATASQVEVEGILRGLPADEKARVIIDFLPGHSEREGGLFFTRDPREGALSLRALGYVRP